MRCPIPTVLSSRRCVFQHPDVTCSVVAGGVAGNIECLLEPMARSHENNASCSHTSFHNFLRSRYQHLQVCTSSATSVHVHVERVSRNIASGQCRCTCIFVTSRLRLNLEHSSNLPSSSGHCNPTHRRYEGTAPESCCSAQTQDISRCF